MTSPKFLHALKRKTKKKKEMEAENAVYLLKASFSIHCGLQVKKTQVGASCEFSELIYKH